jgi:hypothetical protein
VNFLQNRLTHGADSSLARPGWKEGNKLMFLSEWLGFHLVPCLAKKKNLDDSSRLDVVEMCDIVQGC